MSDIFYVKTTPTCINCIVHKLVSDVLQLLRTTCSSAQHTEVDQVKKGAFCAQTLTFILIKDAKVHLLTLSPLRAGCTPILAHGQQALT